MAGNVVILNKNNFDEIVTNGSKPVLVDFWATWCGPCRAVAPVIEELADEYKDRVIVAKVNVDEEHELASRFRIMSIPTVMLFKGEEIKGKIIGARSKEDFAALIDNNI